MQAEVLLVDARRIRLPAKAGGDCRARFRPEAGGRIEELGWNCARCRVRLMLDEVMHPPRGGAASEAKRTETRREINENQGLVGG